MSAKSDFETPSIKRELEEAIRLIPPLWPLGATVAVNPFLGCAQQSLGEASALLASLTGHRFVMPRHWFANRIETGEITDDDLQAAISAVAEHSGLTPEHVKQQIRDSAGQKALTKRPTLVDLAARHTGKDVNGIAADRITAWASNYFDEGQALWQITDRGPAWRSWRDFALNDLTPEILGLEDFCQFVSELPSESDLFIEGAAALLGGGAAGYFAKLLLELGGWSQLARQKLWQAELKGGHDPIMRDMLAVRLAWEVYAYETSSDAMKSDWARLCRESENADQDTGRGQLSDILQFALDHAEQRRLSEIMSETDDQSDAPDRPSMQAAFCIDVRSETFRRALEGTDPSIETVGFAGFFGLGIEHRSFASDVAENRLPVLLKPALNSSETSEENQAEDRAKRYRLRAVRAWGRFKLAAVSSFAFVESAGPIYIPKLLQGALGLKPKSETKSARPRLDATVGLDARTDAAETILRAMSLTSDFARLVVLAGHGAKVTNNPHESALQCGACGGYSGDVNARLLAGLLNDAEVRAALRPREIDIPDDTFFIGALHDTTSDAVSLFEDDVPGSHGKDLADAKAALSQAGERARAERALGMPGRPKPAALKAIGRSWSQTRPEWGLAGCNAFIAAPRSRTLGKSFGGRSFLHSYDWRQDRDFKVLELILTAPVVVASWISLQYYGSTVAPGLFGAGNKLLHNVVGGVGVLEGNGGLLRAGLPLQSVSDGQSFRHTPSRLSVCVEAPCEAIAEVLEAHPSVKDLFDNHWLHLFAMDEAGALRWRYGGNGKWEEAFGQSDKIPQKEAAA